MYTLLDVISAAEARAETVAFKDRVRYSRFVEAAEHYAAAHELIVGGASATRLLLGDPTGSGVPAPIGFDSFKYEFYSGSAPTHARALADALHAVDGAELGRYVSVRTKVPGHLLTVEVDGRDMFSLTALHVRRGVRMADVMIPSRRPAQFAKDDAGRAVMLLCAGPEIQLMEVYATLCSPARAGAWGELLATEAALREIFRREIGPKLAGVVGGLVPPLEGGGTLPNSRSRVAASGAREFGTRAALRATLLKWAGGPSRVLVGCAAVAMVASQGPGGTKQSHPTPRTGPASHLQVVSATRLETEAEELATLAHRLGVEIQWTISDPNIPTDPRLRRMSVHALFGGQRELVLDVFNAAEYELVPYSASVDASVDASIKVGTPFVLLRFRLADMWTMQVLLKMGVIDTKFAKSVLHAMLTDYTAAADAYDVMIASSTAGDMEASRDRILPLEDYIGRFEEPEVALKRAAQNAPDAKFFAPYMPVMGRAKGLAATHTIGAQNGAAPWLDDEPD